MTYTKIYKQMPVKRTKFYDFQMFDFTPMVNANLDTQIVNFSFMHGLKVIF